MTQDPIHWMCRAAIVSYLDEVGLRSGTITQLAVIYLAPVSHTDTKAIRLSLPFAFIPYSFCKSDFSEVFTGVGVGPPVDSCRFGHRPLDNAVELYYPVHKCTG
jgi:hypothetical protein